jgi:hypothetical protein
MALKTALPSRYILSACPHHIQGYFSLAREIYPVSSQKFSVALISIASSQDLSEPLFITQPLRSPSEYMNVFVVISQSLTSVFSSYFGSPEASIKYPYKLR